MSKTRVRYKVGSKRPKSAISCTPKLTTAEFNELSKVIKKKLDSNDYSMVKAEGKNSDCWDIFRLIRNQKKELIEKVVICVKCEELFKILW